MKEIICQTCQDKRYVHIVTAWKHASYACPDCNTEQFEQGVKNMKANAEAVVALIKLFGKPGAD